MKLLKLFQSLFTQPQDPSSPSVVNYEGVESIPATPSMSIEEASQYRQCGGWYTQGVKGELPEGEQPNSGPTPMDDAFQVHTKFLGATGSGKTFNPSSWGYDPDDIDAVKEQIKHAAQEVREAQERYNALIAEHLSHESTDAEIAAKTFPQYFKENDHER